jgi:hypothetical protein
VTTQNPNYDIGFRKNNGSEGKQGVRIIPLTKAADAIEIITDGLSIEQVIGKIIDLYQNLG